MDIVNKSWWIIDNDSRKRGNIIFWYVKTLAQIEFEVTESGGIFTCSSVNTQNGFRFGPIGIGSGEDYSIDDPFDKRVIEALEKVFYPLITMAVDGK